MVVVTLAPSFGDKMTRLGFSTGAGVTVGVAVGVAVGVGVGVGVGLGVIVGVEVGTGKGVSMGGVVVGMSVGVGVRVGTGVPSVREKIEQAFADRIVMTMRQNMADATIFLVKFYPLPDFAVSSEVYISKAAEVNLTVIKSSRVFRILTATLTVRIILYRN